ncbi:hypothetical protein [Demequina sp. NBRC 110055]|uniref:hypothetical protein n=1 Tax=Demequina sp. NBRC 110055 TaxID=1570344 RepID=UPI000A061C56|nr:hypothetical protein [Demequina sp. NBRC 110055]
MSDYIEWSALGQVLLYGILVGAGLPTIFAIGVRLLAGPGAVGADGTVSRGRVIGAWACFAVVVLAILGAVAYIAAGGH